MNVGKAFGIVLKQERLKSNMTQDDLAAHSGYTREFISLLERGQKIPSLKTFLDLADSLNVSPVDMLKLVKSHLD